jgi:uncharacterized membrane protein HdeD (DUF308 family)
MKGKYARGGSRRPSSRPWMIGLFLDIDLISYGLSWIAITFGLRAM